MTADSRLSSNGASEMECHSISNLYNAFTRGLEPRYTDPYVPWCGRSGTARLPLSRSVAQSCQSASSAFTVSFGGKPDVAWTRRKRHRPDDRPSDGRCTIFGNLVKKMAQRHEKFGGVLDPTVVKRFTNVVDNH